MLKNKRAYFQGGGGVNEPTPGQRKYKADPAIVVQPRFKEPLYRNYDLYTIPGMEDIGPGTGYHSLQNYNSIQEFLSARRERLKSRYVSDDSWIMDNGKKTKENPSIKSRASIFERIIKTAKVDMADDNKDYMMPPKEHGTSIYNWKNSPYQGIPGIKKKKNDVNHIDFPIDDQINHYDQMIYPEEGQYHRPSFVGPSGTDDISTQPGNEGSGLFQSSFQSAQIAGEHSYLPEHDLAGRSEDALNFGRDYDENMLPARGLISDEKLQQLYDKYLNSPGSNFLGLPDGIVPESDLDAEQTEDVEDLYDGISSNISNEIYSDKWNI